MILLAVDPGLRCHASRKDLTRCRNEGPFFYCARHADRIGIKNLETEEGRRFWAMVEENARAVAKWPAWRQAGISVGQLRSEPRK